MSRRKRNASAIQAETVEARLLLTASLVGDVLTIQGTPGNDKVSVTVDDGLIEVQVNRDRWHFNEASVASLQIDTFEGNDKVNLGDDVTVPSVISTGDGNDKVVGGAGDDTVSTGAGKDKIVTLDGDDDIDAGGGVDKVVMETVMTPSMAAAAVTRL